MTNRAEGCPDIRFGVGGYPMAFTDQPGARDRGKVFAWLRSIGLTAIELQMTYGPRTPVDTCLRYRDLAADHDIRMSVHGSYYIVLGSADPAKVARSADTLRRTFELAEHLDAREIVLHPGSLYGLPEAEAAQRFAENLNDFMDDLGQTETCLMIETAGKRGQMGSVDMILDVAGQIDGVCPCVDFGHVHARTGGKLSDKTEIAGLFAKVSAFQRANPEKRMHFHYTPIQYGPRGEIQHRALQDVEDGSGKPYGPRPEPVVEGLVGLKGSFTVISETHNSQEQGALRLRDLVQATVQSSS